MNHCFYKLSIGSSSCDIIRYSETLFFMRLIITNHMSYQTKIRCRTHVKDDFGGFVYMAAYKTDYGNIEDESKLRNNGEHTYGQVIKPSNNKCYVLQETDQTR